MLTLQQTLTLLSMLVAATIPGCMGTILSCVLYTTEQLTQAVGAVVVNRAGQLDATVQQINAIMDAEKCSAKRLFRPRPA